MTLPNLGGVAVSDKERIEARSKFETMEKVEKELELKGLVVGDKPPPYQRPEITAEHLNTDLNKDYTTLFAQQLAWLNYTSPILAQVKATILGLTNSLKDIEAKIKKELKDKNRSLPKEARLTESDIEDHIWLDPSHKELTLKKQIYDQKKLLLDAFVETMENNMRVISRQVEIRKVELGGVGLENRLPTRGERFPSPRR